MILRNWLTWLWMLANLKSAGQPQRLETQCRIRVQGQRQSAGRILSFEEGSLSLSTPSTDLIRPTNIIESNVIYSKSANSNVGFI